MHPNRTGNLGVVDDVFRHDYRSRAYQCQSGAHALEGELPMWTSGHGQQFDFDIRNASDRHSRCVHCEVDRMTIRDFSATRYGSADLPWRS